ncbi:MAG: nucleotidyltransferase domain-containing protein [Nitrospirae bacterium]|nr:nucleotidyltransferase domain-containing protein [Nitrospirota bacterium]
MERSEAISRLKQHEADLKRLGVEHLFMFGSTSRDEAHEDSDVDLFFDYPKGSIGLFKSMDIKNTAAAILECKTDLMTRRSLHHILWERIEKLALQVF